MLEPEQINSSLSKDKLHVIAELIVSVRSECFQDADVRDSPWGFGCRAYDWVRNEIIQLAENGEYIWLDIVDRSLKFIFSINDVNVSIYRGTPDKPKNSIVSRAVKYPEMKQIALFQDEVIPEKISWTFVVETDDSGLAIEINFVGLSESGSIVAFYKVPMDIMQSTLASIDKSSDQEVQLPSASVSLKSVDKENVRVKFDE